MKPGMPLSEKEIAARYGVSRQPVREAFISLSRAGLLEIHPRRGTFVVKISLDRMLEARFIRESMEVAVVRRACQRFDARVRTRMDFYLDVQETAAESGAHYDFQRADELFHAAIAEGAGCPSAWTVMENIKAHMDRVCHLTLPSRDGATAADRSAPRHPRRHRRPRRRRRGGSTQAASVGDPEGASGGAGGTSGDVRVAGAVSRPSGAVAFNRPRHMSLR